jgi:predicted nucleotidyltransferase
MDMEKLAVEFAKETLPYWENLQIQDIALFGSLARKVRGISSREPRDVDTLLFHSSNPFLESYELELQRRKDLTDGEKYALLSQEFELQGIDLPALLRNPIIAEGIACEKLQVHCLDTRFFSDEMYKQKMVALNTDPCFYKNLFTDALLFDPETSEFNAHLDQKYPVTAVA